MHYAFTYRRAGSLRELPFLHLPLQITGANFRPFRHAQCFQLLYLHQLLWQTTCTCAACSCSNARAPSSCYMPGTARRLLGKYCPPSCNSSQDTFCSQLALASLLPGCRTRSLCLICSTLLQTLVAAPASRSLFILACSYAANYARLPAIKLLAAVCAPIAQ